MYRTNQTLPRRPPTRQCIHAIRHGNAMCGVMLRRCKIHTAHAVAERSMQRERERQTAAQTRRRNDNTTYNTNTIYNMP